MKKIKKNSAVKVTKVENGELQAKEANFKMNSLNSTYCICWSWLSFK